MARKFTVSGSVASAALALSLVGGGVLATYGIPESRGGHDKTSVVQTVNAADIEQGLVSFAPVVKRATPAVVNISSTRIVKASERGGRGGGQLPFDLREFFGDQVPGFGGPPEDRRQEGEGSGVIVNAEGYLLTNNHVVENASEVNVVLGDKREFRAKIVGTDPQTDIAVLKIDAKGLPFLPMSDSSRVQVGDLAMAIGNPFGIGQTVTMGIIGATGRAVGIGAEGGYEDFIQTDAAINPGNSGGALINTRGELIGINTAIISRGGGNQGVGFAVPINLARNVMDQIIKTGKVTRSWLGVKIQEVTPTLARGFGMKESVGVAVVKVEPNTPAAGAGLSTGDVIIALNGQPIVNSNAFRLKIASSAPGTEVKLRVFRDGRERDVNVKLGEMPSERASGGPVTPGEGTESRALEGVSVDTLTPQIARQLRLPAQTTGVVVTEVGQASAAFSAGLRRGDVIEEVNRQRVTSVSEFERAVAQSGKQPVLLLVNRGGQSTFIAVEQR